MPKTLTLAENTPGEVFYKIGETDKRNSPHLRDGVPWPTTNARSRMGNASDGFASLRRSHTCIPPLNIDPCGEDTQQNTHMHRCLVSLTQTKLGGDIAERASAPIEHTAPSLTVFVLYSSRV